MVVSENRNQVIRKTKGQNMVCRQSQDSVGGTRFAIRLQIHFILYSGKLYSFKWPLGCTMGYKDSSVVTSLLSDVQLLVLSNEQT